MRSYYFLSLLLLCLLSACTARQNTLPPAISTSIELDQWVESDLIPYLAKRLGTYPRFTGQPIHITAMAGDDIKAAPLDGLTLSICDRIKTSLHSVNGVNLTWQPASSYSDNQGNLADLPPTKQISVAYCIGIEIKQSSYDDVVTIQVRALDIKEQSWVDGFGICWKGTLSDKQRRMFNRSFGISSPLAGQLPGKTQISPSQDHISLPPSGPEIIDHFAMMVPNEKQLCNTENPWIMGERPLAANETLSNGDCIAVTLSPTVPAYLILVHQDEFGELHTLKNTWTSGEGMISPGIEYRFPESGSGAVLQLKGYSGTEWIYAITILDEYLAANFDAMLSGRMGNQAFYHLLAELENRQDQLVDYQSISFVHL